MKFKSFFFVAFAICARVAAQSEAASLYPPCALGCIVESVPKSSCSLTNQTCICTNAPLTVMIGSCVKANCTIREALTTQNASATVCGAPIRDHTKLVSYPGVIGGVLALIAVILRLCARIPAGGGGFGLDDWTICVVMAITIPFSGFSILLADSGLGKDIWTIPFDKITHILYIYFWDELMYLTILPLTKISILFFYLRIFPNKSFRKWVWVTMAACIGYNIAFVLVSVWQCRPIDYAWTHWDKEHQGTCNNINAQGWTSAAINMILDVIVIILPLPSLSKLELSRKRKIMILLMFSVGFFVTIVSILRLRTILRFGDSENVTWDYVALGYWSTIEIHVGIICACMPALRSFFKHIWPRVFKVTENRSTKQTPSPFGPGGLSSLNYDYVVVGSGPGGGPTAARLALAGYKVLLMDAGDDYGNDLYYRIPAMHLYSTGYDKWAWDFFVKHYSDANRAKQDSKFTWKTPAGKYYVGPNPPSGSKELGIWYPRVGALGGCSAHNAMIFICPHASDWQHIVDITGDSSWSPSNMRKYFQKLEKANYIPNSVAGHGFNGWLTTSITDLSLVVEDRKLLSLVVAAATAMGQGLLGKLITTVLGLGQVLARDINNNGRNRDTDEGLYQVPISTKNSERTGPRDFILEVANAKNRDGSRKYHLDIKLNTFVTKILFDKSSNRPTATGVEYLSGPRLYRADPNFSSSSGTKGTVKAAKEVIISAGAFNTPQLLKLSGIGPAAELRRFNIPVVADLPGVGTNLQDRYETAVIARSPTPFFITKNCKFLQSSPDPCLDAWQRGSTPAGKFVYHSNGFAVSIVKKSTAADPALKAADLFISGAPAAWKGYYPGTAQDALEEANSWVWYTLKAHTRNNAGTVTLRSANPLDTPEINFRYFDDGVRTGGADNADLQALFEGTKMARKIFKNVVPLDGDFEETWPGPNITSDADLKQWIKNEAWGHHASCTCPIGGDGDRNAVLDSKFRVRGVQKLRVVDASVFPRIPGTFIAAPVYMISEKAADAILADA
ncbi:GMC oxidoreductase [Patellaria atrata CBS 101060]|uniref:GMC oxidoreductase n=1 Tax=Patellaria atrata CBS 101060 TaxID=1346257 RepID=A0A9P4VNW5_9PEZI|nr:GMC oxidoreductase [Patellaria atrata CBS 101060]